MAPIAVGIRRIANSLFCACYLPDTSLLTGNNLLLFSRSACGDARCLILIKQLKTKGFPGRYRGEDRPGKREEKGFNSEKQGRSGRISA
jgi:hypothetical protein